MFDVPGSDISAVIISEAVVRGKEAANYIRSPRSADSEADDDSGYEEEERRMHH